MDDKTKIIYDQLVAKYNKVAIGKKELAEELNVSKSTIDNYLMRGYGLPRYRKVGNTRHGRVIFPLVEVAKYLAESVEVA